MIRLFLAVVATGLFVWGGLYWFEIRHAGYNPPVHMTLANVLSGPPAKYVADSFRGDSSRPIIIDSIEADLSRALPEAYHNNFHYAPVKETDDRVYVEFFKETPPPAGSFRLIGYLETRIDGGLPDVLMKKLKENKLHVVKYGNVAHTKYQRREAIPWFIIGGIVLGLAGLLQLVSSVMWLRNRSKVAEAMADAQATPGPCAICGANGPRIPVYITAEKRRLIAPRLRRTTTASASADFCPRCFARLGALKQIWVVGQVAGVFLIFGAIMGVVLAFGVRGPGILVLPIVAGLFFALNFWVNRTYDRTIGRTIHAGLKQRLNVTFWNPLADHITAVRSSLPKSLAPPGQPAGSSPPTTDLQPHS